MASKKHRPEEAVAKLRQVDVLVSRGQSVAEAIRAIGVTEVTYCRWLPLITGAQTVRSPPDPQPEYDWHARLARL